MMQKIGTDAYVLETMSHTALLTSSRLVLVDTATESTAQTLLSEIQACGYQPKDIETIIITHYHGDHIGGLATMKKISEAKIACHELEVDRIKQNVGILIDDMLNDHNVYEGMLIIHTPGHTKGHIALLDQEAGLLVAGDSFMTGEGNVTPMADNYNENPAEHRLSMKKLLDYQFSKVIVAHGHPLHDSGRTVLETAIKQL